jgi:hypothetical protein
MRTLILLTVLAMLLFACTPQEQQQVNDAMDDSATGSSDQPQSTDGSNPQTEGTSGQTGSTDGQSSTMTEAQKKISNYAQNANIMYKVTYDMTATAQGYSTSGTMTQYIKGMNKFRTDMTTQGMETRTYMDGATVTSCNMMNSAWSCRTIEITPEMKAQQDAQQNPAQYDVTELPSRTIAGAQADCFQINNVNGYTVEYCYSSQGVPLYMKTSGAQYTSEMTATSFTTVVSDADFVPPATDTSSGAAGGTQPAGSSDCESMCAQVPADYRDQCLASC